MRDNDESKKRREVNWNRDRPKHRNDDEQDDEQDDEEDGVARRVRNRAIRERRNADDELVFLHVHEKFWHWKFWIAIAAFVSLIASPIAILRGYDGAIVCCFGSVFFFGIGGYINLFLVLRFLEHRFIDREPGRLVMNDESFTYKTQGKRIRIPWRNIKSIASDHGPSTDAWLLYIVYDSAKSGAQRTLIFAPYEFDFPLELLEAFEDYLRQNDLRLPSNARNYRDYA